MKPSIANIKPLLVSLLWTVTTIYSVPLWRSADAISDPKF